jgi:hypothetical protein
VEPIQKLLSDKRESVHGTFIFTGAAGAEDRNLAVTGLRLAAGLAPVDRALRFDVQVSNFGATEQRGVRVSLAMNNEPASDETLIDVIPPGESRSVSMFAKLRGMGYHTVRATIPADHLPADDSRTLAVRATTRVNVLLVDGEAGREPRDGETFFLRHALVPVPAAEAYDYFIRTDTISPAELPTTKLDDYDAVFLCNVNDFSDRVLEQFAAYLRRGGGLVVLPGGNTRAEFYNDKMLGQYRFLPAALGPAVGDAQSETPHTSFQSEGFEHEISELWNAKSAGDVTAARFYREFELTTDGSTVATQPAGPARVVMRYANGRPAIMERAWGQGRVVLFSSTADTAWNDLPVRPGIFIPLMHRTLGAIVARQDESLNVRVGQRFTYRATPDLLGRDAIIQKPSTDDPELARTTRKLELRGEDVVLYYEDTGRAGTYEVSIAGDSPMEIRFAAQADPAESDLKMVAPEIKTAIGGSAQIIDWQPGVSLEGDFHTRRSGTEVWVTVAMLALCVAVAEMFLAQWFSLPK